MAAPSAVYVAAPPWRSGSCWFFPTQPCQVAGLHFSANKFAYVPAGDGGGRCFPRQMNAAPRRLSASNAPGVLGTWKLGSFFYKTSRATGGCSVKRLDGHQQPSATRSRALGAEPGHKPTQGANPLAEKFASGRKSEAPASCRSAGQDRRPNGTAPPTPKDHQS
jgi:hypothetical protein